MGYERRSCKGRDQGIQLILHKSIKSTCIFTMVHCMLNRN
jgi:hypothetical protein